MANRAIAVILVLATAMTLSGCGTVGNLVGPEGISPTRIPRLSPDAQVYGGVRRDADLLHFCFELLTDPKGQMVWLLTPWFPPCLVLDLALSAVGDTLTLPLAIQAERERQTFESLPLAVYAEGKRQTAEMKPPPDGPPSN